PLSSRQNPVVGILQARLRLRVALGNPQRAIVRHRNPGLSHLAFTPEPRVPHVWQHEFGRTLAIGQRDYKATLSVEHTFSVLEAKAVFAVAPILAIAANNAAKRLHAAISERRD